MDTSRSTTACGAVLAGGASRRMGRPKAELVIGGEPLLHRVTRLLRAAVPDVVVVGDPLFAPLVPEVRVYPDAIPRRGPLGGLATAFDISSAEWLVLVACDMPLIRPPLLRAMAATAASLSLAGAEAHAVAVRGPRGLEPLLACYSRRCVPIVERHVSAAQWSLRGLLDALTVHELPVAEWQRYDPEMYSTVNVNTPEEWARARVLVDGESA